MPKVAVVGVKEHRGAPRVWMEGVNAKRSGFSAGQKYSIEDLPNGIVLRLESNGTYRVSKKVRKDQEPTPVIDLNSNRTLGALAGCKAVRIAYGDKEIRITRLASEERLIERLTRAKRKINTGEPLRAGGIAAGGGILSSAAHEGLSQAGLLSRIALHNEIREDLTEHVEKTSRINDENTVYLNVPIQELAFDDEALGLVGSLDILELGLPCSGASVSGRSKNKLAMAEDHEHVGHLVAPALAIIAKLNPLVCVLENVKPYANTASASILRKQLRDMGYQVHETELFGPDFGEMEARRRWCMVACSNGIDVDLQSVRPEPFAGRQLHEIMDAPETVADRWSEMTGLKAKQERDIEQGKGFRMQVYTGEENRINTLTKGLWKRRSTDPKFQHPENPNLLRDPTPAEHARAKGIPEEMIAGLSIKNAHELLGQSIVYKPFVQVFKHIGERLTQWAAADQTLTPQAHFGFAA